MCTSRSFPCGACLLVYLASGSIFFRVTVNVHDFPGLSKKGALITESHVFIYIYGMPKLKT